MGEDVYGDIDRAFEHHDGLVVVHIEKALGLLEIVMLWCCRSIFREGDK